MTTTEFYKALHYVNHSREKRDYYSNLLINNPNLIPITLDVLFMVNDKNSPRAAWILEFMCKANLELFLPYLDVFLEKVNTVHLDAAVRPCAKICEYITEAYYGRLPSKTKKIVTTYHKEKITENCFDWLINDKQKVAAKAYAMRSLFLLGKEFEWIYPELKLILQQNYPIQSAAYKARARAIFKDIK